MVNPALIVASGPSFNQLAHLDHINLPIVKINSVPIKQWSYLVCQDQIFIDKHWDNCNIPDCFILRSEGNPLKVPPLATVKRRRYGEPTKTNNKDVFSKAILSGSLAVSLFHFLNFSPLILIGFDLFQKDNKVKYGYTHPVFNNNPVIHIDHYKRQYEMFKNYKDEFNLINCSDSDFAEKQDLLKVLKDFNHLNGRNNYEEATQNNS